MKIAIIGAGPAGLTAAYELTKAGKQVEVFEAGNLPGGMAKTIRLWNQHVDTGPHRFFSKDKRVNELWLEVVGRDYRIVERLTRIFYQQKFYFYPLNPLNVLRNMGWGQAAVCVGDYLKEMAVPTRLDGSFETWVTRRFGRRLYEIFFKPYSEKLWGLPCSELDDDFAAQRIKKLSLFEALKNAIVKDRRHRTLADQFAYPNKGTGMVYQRMADYVTGHGGAIVYKTPVEKVMFDEGKGWAVDAVGGRSFGGYTHLISTMPLSLLIKCLNHVPSAVSQAAASLRFRNTILIYLNVDSDDLFPDQWIYVQSPEYKTGRLTNFRNWVPDIYGDEKSTILLAEFWCNDGEALWQESPENLIALAAAELKQMGFGNARILDGHVERIPRCYPIYYKGYKNDLKVIQEYLDTIPGLSVIGRYGAFKYNNQDHSILMGIEAAANILRSEKKDLWAINTDFEEYQESFIITRQGLVRE